MAWTWAQRPTTARNSDICCGKHDRSCSPTGAPQAEPCYRRLVGAALAGRNAVLVEAGVMYAEAWMDYLARHTPDDVDFNWVLALLPPAGRV
jgi:hypothetical protein